MEAQGYKKLQIYQLAHQLAVKVHKMSLKLPSFERFEEGSQIRRSSKSVASNIVEGFALQKYKNEFVHDLFRVYGSCEETVEHMEFLFDTKSLDDESSFKDLHQAYNNLCGKILRFIQTIERTFDVPNFLKEPLADYKFDRLNTHGIEPFPLSQNSKPKTLNSL